MNNISEKRMLSAVSGVVVLWPPHLEQVPRFLPWLLLCSQLGEPFTCLVQLIGPPKHIEIKTELAISAQ